MSKELDEKLNKIIDDIWHHSPCEGYPNNFIAEIKAAVLAELPKQQIVFGVTAVTGIRNAGYNQAIKDITEKLK